MRTLCQTFAGVVCLAALSHASEPIETARPIPLTRPEMKQMLEDMKVRKLRIPLPELSETEKAELGDRSDSYESRLRYHYMPPGDPSTFGSRGSSSSRSTTPTATGASREFSRNADENMTLKHSFKTMLFWIVSRTNNCQYCLGHQESKLAAAGLTEEQVAALDFDWARYSPAEQAAFAYARKLTYQPNALHDADIQTLQAHYTDLQILEMTMSVAGNNSTNRWKEGTGVPQSRDGGNFFRREGVQPPTDRPVPNESYLTPTAPEFQTTISKVAALYIDEATGRPTRVGVSTRPKLESRSETEDLLASAQKRTSRLPLLSEDAARKALGENAPEGAVPNWMRLMAHFPNDSRGRIRSLQAIESSQGDLTPLLKAQVSWIIARQDRAWYATGVVQKRW
jgi:alkylhydroperoxidase family enzyme